MYLRLSIMGEMNHAEATPSLRSGAAAKRSNTTSKERWLHEGRRAEKSYSTSKVRRGGSEEIPLARGQGRWPGGPTPLRRPEAAAGRTNPTSKERWLQQAQKGLE